MLTTAQRSTFDQILSGASDVIKSSSITRLLNRIITNNDESKMKELAVPLMTYEKTVGSHANPAAFIRGKIKGGPGKQFFTDALLGSGYTPTQDEMTKKYFNGMGKAPPRMGEHPMKERDVGELVRMKAENTVAKSQGGIVERVIGAVNDGSAVDTMKRAGKAYDDAPGSGLLTKAMYLEFPELQYIDRASKMVGLGWAKSDTEYLNNIMNDSYSGTDKNDFKTRLKWVGKLIANPGQWANVIERMGIDAVKKSEVGQWFQRTFGEVANKFDNDTAKELRQSFRSGKVDMSKFKKLEPLEPGKPELSTGEGDTPFGNITPVVTFDMPEDPKRYESYMKHIDGMFDGDDQATAGGRQQAYSSKTVRAAFKRMYKQTHNGSDYFDDGQPIDPLKGLTPKQRDDFTWEINKSIQDVFKKSGAPLQPIKYKNPTDNRDLEHNASAGVLIDSNMDNLLQELIREAESADNFTTSQYMRHGDKFKNDDRSPEQAHNAMLAAIERVRTARATGHIGSAELALINDLAKQVPGDLSQKTAQVATDIGSYHSEMTAARVKRDTPQLTQTAEDTDGKHRRRRRKDGDPDDPGRPGDQTFDRTDEHGDKIRDRRSAELRPKFGMMDQAELEEILVGDAEQKMITNHTWRVVDLKESDETRERDDNANDPNYYPPFQRTVDHYNMRYGQTYRLPDAPLLPPKPQLARRHMRDIYDGHINNQQYMVDAYDNSMWKRVNEGAFDAPEYETLARTNNRRAKNIPVLPYRNGIDVYDYRWPQFAEPDVGPLRNRGRHF